MTPALFFHPDAVEASDKDLVGRRSAGQSFTKAFLNYGCGDQVNVVTETQAHVDAFRTFASDLGEERPIQPAVLRTQQDFTKFGTVFFPFPGYMNAAWQRARGDVRRCSLVGVTHTVSTRRIVESFHNLMLEPVHPWDAIICTSRAVQSVVRRQFDMEAEFINARFGAATVPQPQLPVIPLAIHAADFTRTESGRDLMRKRFNTPDDAVVVMTMGRITSVEKANPVPLFMALQEIAATGKTVHLWMAGWSSREGEQTLHEAGAAQLCPNVVVHFIDGRDAEVRRHIWSGADIFTLPVDNIQETFGLVPLEAMAAGLPVVMPDWNGFRDTVVDGETGYLIPTMMAAPDAPLGNVLATRFSDGTDGYLSYLSGVQQQTCLDVRAYTQALESLIGDADLRRRMGIAARDHVKLHFDWSAVIPQYLGLAEELRRVRERTAPIKQAPNPMEGSPFDVYRAYPTHHLSADTVVTFVRSLDLAGLAALDQLNGRTLYKRKIAADGHVVGALDFIAKVGPLTFGDLLAKTQSGKRTLSGIVLFLAKYDFVTLGPQAPK